METFPKTFGLRFPFGCTSDEPVTHCQWSVLHSKLIAHPLWKAELQKQLQQVTNLVSLLSFNIVFVSLLYAFKVSGKKIHIFHKQNIEEKMFNFTGIILFIH